MCVLEILYLWSLASLLDHLVSGEPSLPTFMGGKCETDNSSRALNSQEKPAVHLGKHDQQIKIPATHLVHKLSSKNILQFRPL